MSIIRSLMVKVGADTSDFSNKMKYVSKDLNGMSKKFDKLGSSLTKNVTTPMIKAAAALATGISVIGASGIQGAAELESYRNTLNTVMKDTKKAGETMAWAVDFANKTPFETDDIIQATVRLSAYGLTAQDVMTDIGNMASVMGTDIMQAVEAVADAQTGELERLKEFGITKKMIVEHGNKVMAGVEIVNQKGQVTNQEKFNEVLFSLMKERFSGGMDVQANTFSGLMSTLKGTFKNALISMVGVSETGEITIGGMFDTIKKKMKLFSEKLEQMKKDGTLKRWADTVQKAFKSFVKVMEDSVIPVLKDVAEFVKVVFEWFADLSPGTQKLVIKMLLLGAALGPVLQTIGGILKVSSNFTKFFSDVTKASATAGGANGIGKFAKGLSALLGPGGLIAAAIIALGFLAVAMHEAVKDYPELVITPDDKADKMGPQPQPAGGWGDFRALQIPAAAKGGIVTKPTLLLAGEAGPEEIRPLNKAYAQTVNHTGTIRVEGVNNRGELVAVVEQAISSKIMSDNRRMPARTSLVALG